MPWIDALLRHHTLFRREYEYKVGELGFMEKPEGYIKATVTVGG